MTILYSYHPRSVNYITTRGFVYDERVIQNKPLGFHDYNNLQMNAFAVVSDSGGIQEEAPSLGKPVLVMRDTTERPEGIEAGTLKLVGTEEENIYVNFKLLLENEEEYTKMSQANNPYGDGCACQRIADILTSTNRR